MGGRGLFRVEVEEEGVTAGDWLVSLDAELGEAVPSFESLFFLEDLLESLPRESSCCPGFQHFAQETRDGADLRPWRRDASSLKTTASRLWGG